MARKLISYSEIEHLKKIIIPKASNIYRIDTENYEIKFYRDNPDFREVELNTWKIYKNAYEVEFEFRDNKIGGHIIIPTFYDSNGKLLKIGNR